MPRKLNKEWRSRRHARTHRHPECVAVMANANFDAVEPLAVAMGLMTMAEYEAEYGPQTCKGGSLHVPGNDQRPGRDD